VCREEGGEGTLFPVARRGASFALKRERIRKNLAGSRGKGNDETSSPEIIADQKRTQKIRLFPWRKGTGGRGCPAHKLKGGTHSFPRGEGKKEETRNQISAPWRKKKPAWGRLGEAQAPRSGRNRKKEGGKALLMQKNGGKRKWKKNYLAKKRKSGLAKEDVLGLALKGRGRSDFCGRTSPSEVFEINRWEEASSPMKRGSYLL